MLELISILRVLIVFKFVGIILIKLNLFSELEFVPINMS